MSERPRAIVLMGVSGCGKTSVGVRLSEILGWPYFDADEYHPASPSATKTVSPGWTPCTM